MLSVKTEAVITIIQTFIANQQSSVLDHLSSITNNGWTGLPVSEMLRNTSRVEGGQKKKRSK